MNVIQQEGGGPFEPLDLNANTRHLDIYLAQITLLDKSWQTQTLGRQRTMDGLEMAALMFGVPVDRLPGFAEGDVSVQDLAAQLAKQVENQHDPAIAQQRRPRQPGNRSKLWPQALHHNLAAGRQVVGLDGE